MNRLRIGISIYLASLPGSGKIFICSPGNTEQGYLHPATCSMGRGLRLLQTMEKRREREGITHFHLAARLKMCRAIPPFV